MGEADKSEQNFNATSVLSESTIKAGYDSSNVVLNSTFQLIMLISVLLIVILIVLIRVFCY